MVSLACLLVASAASGRSDSSSAAAGPPKLGKHDRALLAQARAAGAETVTLLLAANEGQAAAAAGAVQAAGGTIAYRDDDLGYIRVDMPLAQVESVETIASIQAAEVDELIPLPDPSPEASQPAQPQPPPGPATPNDNPYMPIGEIGASAFMAAHPTWDGRGVTIGIVDTGVDLHHPSLQTTSTGERKIVDWVTGTHPSTDNDPTWVNVSTEVYARNGTFTTGGNTYSAPANRGSYFFGVFNERDPRLGGELGNDVNRDGNPAGSSGLFAVLRQQDNVWVDTDQDKSFADETAMREYKKNFQIGIVSMAPLTVRGLSFKPRERIKLLVVAGKPLSRAVRAGPRGGFVARLGVDVKGCQAVVVQAIGVRGSRAMVDVTTPGCDEQPE